MLLRSLHSALAPQGEGMQGVGLSCTELAIKMLQLRNGSPVKPYWHKHMGVWLTTRHSALVPQDPGQGSLHFLLIHAIFDRHSVLLVHSGRQLGGAPRNSGKHLHNGLSPFSEHSELGPHGEGKHGFTLMGGVAARKKGGNNYIFNNICKLSLVYYIKKYTYESFGKLKMDPLNILTGTCILDCDWPQCIVCFGHKRLGMDRYIFD